MARRRAARTVAATCATSAPASRMFDAPKAWSPSRSRCVEAAARRADSARSAASIPNLPAPSSPTRRTRSSRACSETAARRRTGWTLPAAAAIPSRRASSPGDSTVTARIPVVTAAASSTSRLPGPVITIRSAAIPARRAVTSSPPEATSAPSPSRPRNSTTARAGFALTAYARSTLAGRTAWSVVTWRSMTSRS